MKVFIRIANYIFRLMSADENVINMDIVKIVVFFNNRAGKTCPFASNFYVVGMF